MRGEEFRTQAIQVLISGLTHGLSNWIMSASEQLIRRRKKFDWASSHKTDCLDGTQFQQTLLHAQDDRDHACLQYKGITESTFFQYCIVRERGREQIIRVRHYATGSTQTYCPFTRLAVLKELATNVQKETVTSMREREYQPLINQSWKTEVDHACLLMPSGASAVGRNGS